MKRVTLQLLIVLAAGTALCACNLPAAPSMKAPPSAVLTAGVSAAAECRSGPGPAYGLIAALEAGQVVQVVGRSSGDDYLLAQHPENPAVLCWLKRESLAVVGAPESLPIVSVAAPASTQVAVCPSPVGGGPSPVVCSVPTVVGCPSPVGGGATPVDCAAAGASPALLGCPSPVGGGPTPVDCSAGGPLPLVMGCPSPVGGGPTPVDCLAGGPPVSVVGCPSPVGGGPTPVDCSGQGAPSSGGPATLVPGSKPGREPTPVPAGRPLPPTPVP